MVKENWVSGLWVFDKDVPLFKILEAASELSTNDKHYVQIHVRLALKKQYAIAFVYELEKQRDLKHEQEQYFKRTEASLKDIFGAGLVAHEIASPVYKVL